MNWVSNSFSSQWHKYKKIWILGCSKISKKLSKRHPDTPLAKSLLLNYNKSTIIVIFTDFFSSLIILLTEVEAEVFDEGSPGVERSLLDFLLWVFETLLDYRKKVVDQATTLMQSLGSLKIKQIFV